MSIAKQLLVSFGAIVAVVSAGAGAARAQAAPQDVNVVNLVDTNVVNIPDVKIVNVPTTSAIPPSDSSPFIATIDSVPLNNSLITDVSFANLVTNFDDRLIVDFVSVETYVAPNQKSWAAFMPCTEKGNLGRTSLPTPFGGSVFNGDSKVNDAYLGTTAMHNYVDSGCTAVVRVFRGQTSGLGHVNVTIQGHRVKKTLPIVIGR